MKNPFILNKLNTCLILLSASLLIPLLSNAQTGQFITLDQAIKMGFDASNQLKISQGKLDYAQAKRDQTYDYVYPATKVNLSYSRLSDVPDFAINGEVIFPVFQNTFQNHLSLNEIVFAGFRVKTAKEAADKSLGASEFDLKKDKDDVKLNIISAYFNLYKVQKAVEVIVENKRLIDDRLKEIQNLEVNGLATHNDVLKLELQQSNIELAKIDADNVLKAANYNFNLLLGLPGDVTIELDSNEVSVTRSIQAQDAFIASALQNRPEVQALQLRNQVAQDNLKIAKNAYWPTVSAGGNLYYSNPNQRYVPPVDVFHSTWDVGIALNWDITNLFTNRHVIAENNAVLTQSNSQQNQLNDGIKSEVFQEYLNYTEALEKLNVLSKAVLTAQENLKVTESRYRNSIAIVSDLTDAQLQQIQAQINLIIAKADAQIAYYKLQKSSGAF